MVNDATVTLADVNTSNGVIHVIDKVLTPTVTPNDIPRTAQCTGVHNSLVSSVIQAEDGIRDFCLSRGLGDVYKRQP